MSNGLKPGDLQIVAHGAVRAREYAEKDSGNTGIDVREVFAAIADALEVLLRHLHKSTLDE